MDKLGFIMKNQPNDPRFGCTIGPKFIEEYLKIEDNMVLKNEDLIADFNMFEED